MENATGKMLAIMACAAMIQPATATAAPLPRPAAFAMCASCHQTVKNGRNTLGPNLWGIGGRVSGTMSGFNYSPALKKAAIRWDRNSLIAFASNPRAKVPGTRMPYAGQKDPKKAAAIADYLMSLK